MIPISAPLDKAPHFPLTHCAPEEHYAELIQDAPFKIVLPHVPYKQEILVVLVEHYAEF